VKVDPMDDSPESRVYFHVGDGKQSSPSTSNRFVNENPGRSPLVNGEFREVTDRLKIQLLDLVDEIASLHFNHARAQPKPQLLEQLPQLGGAFFYNLPRAELDVMAAQCHTVLDMISQAKEQQDELGTTDSEMRGAEGRAFNF